MNAPIPGSVADEDQWLVPIRMVNSLLYCPREAWDQFTLGDDPLNVHMERGLRRHALFDSAVPETSGLVFRHLPVLAPVLGVQGVIDELRIDGDVATIVEYKATKVPQRVWPGVTAQLVVQSLALREHAVSVRWHGPPLPARIQLRVYFADSRRYRDVALTPDTEQAARRTIAQAQAILRMPSPPPGNIGPRCRECQHEPACLPFDLPQWVAAGGEEGER